MSSWLLHLDAVLRDQPADRSLSAWRVRWDVVRSGWRQKMGSFAEALHELALDRSFESQIHKSRATR